MLSFVCETPITLRKIIYHTVCEVQQVFLRVMGMKPSQGLHLDPNDAGKQHLKIFLGAPSEILAPVTPRVSLGTKIFVSKISSYYPQVISFYAFCGFVLQKMPKN